MRLRSRPPVAGLLLALTLAASLAAAAPTPEGQKARSLFEQGVALSDEGKWAEALIAFQQSDNIVPSATVRFNIAATLRALGRYVEAKRTLEGIVDDPGQLKAPIKRALRQDIDALLVEVKEKIVIVALRLSPTGADLQVDGAPATPLPDGRIELDPGRHVFVVTAKGHETTTMTRTLSTADKEIALSAPPERTRVVQQAAPAPAEAPAPFYARGWFWAIAGAVVVSGAAVAVAVALTQQDAPAPAGPPTRTVDRVIPAAAVRF